MLQGVAEEESHHCAVAFALCFTYSNRRMSHVALSSSSRYIAAAHSVSPGAVVQSAQPMKAIRVVVLHCSSRRDQDSDAMP